MDFNDIVFDLNPIKEREKKQLEIRGKRYVVTYDPVDEDTIKARQDGIFVYVIFDKLHSKPSTKVWTKKPFDDFVTKFVGTDVVRDVLVSNKFIGKDGYPLTIEQIRSRI